MTETHIPHLLIVLSVPKGRLVEGKGPDDFGTPQTGHHTQPEDRRGSRRKQVCMTLSKSYFLTMIFVSMSQNLEVEDPAGAGERSRLLHVSNQHGSHEEASRLHRCHE